METPKPNDSFSKGEDGKDTEFPLTMSISPKPSPFLSLCQLRVSDKPVCNEKGLKTQDMEEEKKEEKKEEEALCTSAPVDTKRSLPVTIKALFTLEEVADHCSPESAWIILWDRVYDVTKFANEHPGGEDIIYEHEGRDATMAFNEVNHSKDAHLLMNQYCIGSLIPEQRIFPASI